MAPAAPSPPGSGQAQSVSVWSLFSQSFLANTNALYWIGLWQDPDGEGRWTWIDGTLYPE